MKRPLVRAFLLVLSGTACSTAGSNWMAEPLTAEYEPLLEEADAVPPPAPSTGEAVPRSRVLGGQPATPAAQGVTGNVGRAPEQTAAGGRSLGTFRNTYYDFPNEADFEGPSVSLKNAECNAIGSVPRPFFESLCVQGSGTLRKGATVSFARRDCECAEICPRTNQRICFDELDAQRFPWGRGATGKPIIPLLSVAVDTDVIPLGTPVYVPEYDGIPRDPDQRSVHDGCFIAQDRGLKVKGKHLDVFTGHQSITTLWNRLVPSNRGVTVVVESQRCAQGR
jgi:3D (Asp-Asp-Asp) domain-containing protein